MKNNLSNETTPLELTMKNDISCETIENDISYESMKNDLILLSYARRIFELECWTMITLDIEYFRDIINPSSSIILHCLVNRSILPYTMYRQRCIDLINLNMIELCNHLHHIVVVDQMLFPYVRNQYEELVWHYIYVGGDIDLINNINNIMFYCRYPDLQEFLPRHYDISLEMGQCVICLDDTTYCQMITRCGHRAHYNCYRQWKKNYCFMCRKDRFDYI
jgi:hypothetical protein